MPEPSRNSRSTALAITGGVILAMLAALLGVVAGLGALIGAATIADRLPLFLLAGLLAFCVAYSLGLLLATRGISSLRKWRARAALLCTGTALIVGIRLPDHPRQHAANNLPNS